MPIVNRDTVEEFWQEETLQACWQPSQSDCTEYFMDKLREFLGANQPLWAMASARVALQNFLAAVIPAEKSTVLVCSFNCPVVADAVLKAGFSLETYDLADRTGRIDWQMLAEQIEPYHGAIVIPHLFGVPCDFRPILHTAKNQGVLAIEDCAHTLGGYIGQQMVGTLGDAAIFSFNYDKPISLGGGGALLVNNSELCQKFTFFHHKNSLDVEQQELRLFLEYLRDRRKRISRQGIARKIFRSFLSKLNISQGKQLLPTDGIGPIRASLGIWQLERYKQIIQKRNSNAALFQGQPYYQSWYVSPEVCPAWLKQKVISIKPQKTSIIAHQLQRRGLRAGTFNWNQTIDAYLKRTEKKNAVFTAKYALDIPIHQNMISEELNYVHSVLSEGACL